MTNPQLIVVDDDLGMAELVKNVGEPVGFDVRITTSSEAFQKVWEEDKPSVIILDIVMPDMDGIELLSWLAERKCSSPIILMSGYEGKYLEIAGRLGAGKGANVIGTLNKPFKINELEAVLKKALAASRAMDEKAEPWRNNKLIVVDDDPDIRNFISEVAEELGFEVGEAKSGREYLSLFGGTHAEVIILDIAMPGEHGLGLFEFIHDHHQQSKIAIITGYSDVFLDGAMRLGVEKGLNIVGGLNKPIKLDDLEKLLKDALKSSK